MPTNCHCACTIFFAPETITTSCRNHVLHPSSRQIVEVPRVTWPCSPKLNKAQCPPLTEDPTTAWPKAACRLTQKIGITHTHTLPKRPHVTTVGNPSDFETTFFCTFRSLDLFPFKTCGSSEHLRCCPKTRCCGCYRLSQHVPSHNLSRVKKTGIDTGALPTDKAPATSAGLSDGRKRFFHHKTIVCAKMLTASKLRAVGQALDILGPSMLACKDRSCHNVSNKDRRSWKTRLYDQCMF